MNNTFNISVVIPVYNAAPYIRKAVSSALQQPEVSEVVLVEDKSPDNSLEICYALAQEDARVKLFRHPGGENRGAAASRNLGVRMAASPYIAFLDADDYYLPGRFKKAGEILTENPAVDGVYDAIGLHIYSSEGLERYAQYKGKKMDPEQLISVKQAVPPELLFERLVLGKIGIFHANGITLKKDFVIQTGLFDEDLDIVEDTVLWLKLAFHGTLAAGTLNKAVAMQGIHDFNREPDMQPSLLFQKYHRLFSYFLNKPVSKKVLRTLFTRMIAYHPKRTNARNSKFKTLELLCLATIELIKHPGWIFKLLI